ncbi:proton-conducting transporter membrane subunit [Nitrospira sp. KM1]|uniref:proton-conducting transporter transmembrane domain-containing protein n=1 Tax=Nitrospira sp. KM1 TaxID=1936990 RepID=UPI001565C480|nr:proton-conducting transporter membrane subunit [Nitrospira sp. KM1]
MIPWLLAGIPLVGMLACLPFRSDPGRLKQSSVAWAMFSLVSVAGCANRIDVPPEGLLPLFLLPLAATISILGQPVHEHHRLSWMLTLLFLGLGLSAISIPPPIGFLSLTLLLALIAGLLYRHHSELWPRSSWGIGAYGFGALCAVASAAADAPLSSVASLLTCAVLLPLVPFHDGHLTALTRLPGSLPSFIVVLLPLAGLHHLAAAMPTIPDIVAWTVSLFALAGASYGALKALAQSRVRLLLAYGSLSFFSILWWFAAASRTATPRSALLVGTVGLATSGLMIAWQVIRTRYGDDVDPQAISGLATGMPKYAVLLSLLALAAMGLPPFGVFAGFMGLLLSPPFPSLAGLFFTLLAWLAASWYIMQMVQRLLFGVRRPELRYTDLLQAEFASLLIVVLVLLALGLAPTTLFASERALLGTVTAGDSPTWIP